MCTSFFFVNLLQLTSKLWLQYYLAKTRCKCTTISLDWQIMIERLNVYMTSVTNVATYVPCKMKQEWTTYVYIFFFGEFFSADIIKMMHIPVYCEVQPTSWRRWTEEEGSRLVRNFARVDDIVRLITHWTNSVKWNRLHYQQTAAWTWRCCCSPCLSPAYPPTSRC